AAPLVDERRIAPPAADIRPAQLLDERGRHGVAPAVDTFGRYVQREALRDGDAAVLAERDDGDFRAMVLVRVVLRARDPQAVLCLFEPDAVEVVERVGGPEVPPGRGRGD